MIGIDTNILVRYITQDDPQQSALAEAFLATLSTEHPGFVSLVTLTELCWVLNRRYKLSRAEFVDALQNLLNSKELQIEVDLLVRRAIELFEQNRADFGDCLVQSSCRAAGCDSIVTFDRKAAKSLGMQLLS